MKIVAFCGPTLAAGLVRDSLASDEIVCQVMPPAARGDLLAASFGEPHVIALVDGYFDRVPSVWHKEILWCLSRGIHVWGASSMGALRAAELAEFGMVGIGHVFEEFRSGALTADDAVAVAHGDADSGFRSASDALVNIRATLQAARSAHVLGQAPCDRLLQLATALPYWQRSYAELLRRAGADPSSSREVEALRAWLARGRIDQKAEDALLLFRLLRERRGELLEPFRAQFAFSATDAWHALRAEVESRALVGSGNESEREASWLDELWVSADYAVIWQGALARALAEHGSKQQAVLADKAVQQVAADFRREYGLLTQQQLEAWLTEERLTGSSVETFFRSEAALRRARAVMRGRMNKYLLLQARALGRLGALAARAERKERVLRRYGLGQPSLTDIKLTEQELWRWYFTRVRGISVPAALESYGENHGVDIDALRRAIVREYCYLQVAGAL